MEKNRVLLIVNNDINLRYNFASLLLSLGLDVITPPAEITIESIPEFLAGQPKITSSFVDLRQDASVSKSEISKLYDLIIYFINHNISVFILSNAKDDENREFIEKLKVVLPIQSQKIFVGTLDEEIKQSPFTENQLSIGEWALKLAGDSSTDAPPPKSKKEKK